MYVDGAQIIVEYECGRVLPGWVPRRLGEREAVSVCLLGSVSCVVF